MNDVELARWAATHAHEGQKRWGGEPYITHPERVAARFDDPLLKSVALLHDVVEDTETTLDDLRNMGFPEVIVNAVDHITKREGERYVDYIKRVLQNVNAAAVKVADLEDNLTDLKKGSMRDKYELARWVILKSVPYAAGVLSDK